MNKSSNYGSQQRDGRSKAKEDDNNVWHNDAFFKMEAEPAAPVRKRHAFREKKVPVESENIEKAATEPARPSYPDRPASESERRDERDSNAPPFDRSGRPDCKS